MTYNYFVDISSWFFISFFMFTMLNTVIDNILEYLNNRKTDIESKAKEIHKINPLFKKLFSLPKIKKSIKYHNEHKQLSDLSSCVTSSFSMFFLLFGITPFVFNMIYSYIGNTTCSYIIFSVILTILSTLMNIPFSYYAIFNIESRYGFNKSSKALFFYDSIKGMAINVVMNTIIIYLLNTFLLHFGKFEVVHVLMFIGAVTLFSFLMSMLSSSLFLRMFNKLTPIKDKKLTSAVKRLFNKCGYKNTPKLFVMDSSRRSSHGNAFVTGFGSTKKIVLFDTLLKKHTTEEIISILAHEIGHDKHHDMLKGSFIQFLKLSIISFIIFSMIYDINLYHAFGFRFVTEDNILSFSLLGIFLASMVIIPIKSLICTPIESVISRRMEYAADTYSAEHTSSKSMTSSLIRLSSDNLSDLFPHRLYEIWYYDHPSIVNRIKNLNNVRKNKLKREIGTKRKTKTLDKR